MSQVKEEVGQVLSDPNSPDYPRGIRGILASLYRKILLDLAIKPASILNLCNRESAIQKKENSSASAKKITGTSILKSLMNDTMTFKVFCLGLKVLRPDSVRITITINRHGRETHHSIPISFEHKDIDEED